MINFILGFICCYLIFDLVFIFFMIKWMLGDIEISIKTKGTTK